MTLIKMCGVVILKLQKIERGTKNTMKRIAEMKNKMLAGVGGARDTAQIVVKKTKEGVDCSKTAIMSKLDQDGNGTVDSVDIILMALKVPGVKIKRAEFLQKEFYKNYSQEVIDMAIATTPARAGIPIEEINKISDEVIKFERNAVSGISMALGLPGGVAMAATIPADIAQYYGYMLRAAQKMLYLYGFPELNIEGEDGILVDTEIINCLTICLGIMYGVAGANNALKAMAQALAAGVEKKLLRAALTKGTVYPIVKSVAKWFNVNMTKKIFAGFFKNAIPVVGGAIGGGLTFVTFEPCCHRLRNTLIDTKLTNPYHQSGKEEEQIYDNIRNEYIDVEYEEIVEE